ncbi:TetR/AcrR family transcriptional regulator [Cellulomonas sp. APG4]|uniref:TetR/AcrR family transcriptional regulator n=1 Tax=Cellulomonas sp. APG4 TaxID=1538656 RepID=UPI0013797DB8|nr:TetR/AcrR family transcriptional regulator [Cellulomonas sp. APG4]NCT90921.1 TetR/AcrR family transcriptional regulator [Cellulomonas sp. APG4]
MTRSLEHGGHGVARSRTALVRAAREVFAERGLHAPLSAVARRAGVGQGSLYRHFPERGALVLAAFTENVERLESLAAEPGATLENVLAEALELAERSSAFMDAVAADDPAMAELGARVRALLAGLVPAGHRDGTLAPDVDADDVLLGLLMLSSALGSLPAAERPGSAARARALVRRAWTARPDKGRSTP